MKVSSLEDLRTYSVEQLMERIQLLERGIDAYELENDLYRKEAYKYAELYFKYGPGEMPSYSKDWSWITKVIFIIKEANMPLRSCDVGNALINREPGLRGRDTVKFLSNYFKIGTDSGRISAIKINGIKGKYYALPEWMDQNGKLLSEYTSKLDTWI